MTETNASPAGWHPDPLPPQPGQPAQLRYWDGTQWTEHVSPAPAAQQYYGYGAAPASRSATPDGAPLAGWWHRVGATILDGLIQLPIVLALAFPWTREIYEIYRDYMRQVIDDAEAGRQTTVSAWDLQSELIGPLAVVTVIGVVLGLAYNVGFLMWRQATPGKLMTGLRVRLRETPGPMPLGTVLLRWLGQFGIGILGLVPFVGSVAGLYRLLDVLWPLWDGNRQAIHDKIAKTNVVRVR